MKQNADVPCSKSLCLETSKLQSRLKLSMATMRWYFRHLTYIRQHTSYPEPSKANPKALQYSLVNAKANVAFYFAD